MYVLMLPHFIDQETEAQRLATGTSLQAEGAGQDPDPSSASPEITHLTAEVPPPRGLCQMLGPPWRHHGAWEAQCPTLADE